MTIIPKKLDSLAKTISGCLELNNKPGGLYSRDQLRLGSRMSLVSRLTFLQCRDFLDGQDRPFFSRRDF
jgi:hypothetical protein